MSKDLQYRQCHLKKKKDGETYWEQVSWIPEPYCRVGKVLKLRDEKGEWVDGWQVVSAGSPLPAATVEGMSRDYLRTNTK